jgi:tetratricopeptide (TPR) repeat protein
MGRHLFNQGTRTDLAAAVRRFQAAIGRDPRYAMAHVGLAEACGHRFAYHECHCRQHLDLARRAATEAVSLAPELAEAHAVRGFVHLLDWKWPQAAASLDRALELYPRLAVAHHYRAHYLQAMGRLEAARRAQERSAEVDPASNFAHGWLALFRLRSGRLREARDVPELPPDQTLSLPLARIIAGQSHVLEGDRAAGIALLERARQDSPDDPILLASLGWAYALAGDRTAARRVLATLQRERAGQPLRPFLLAKVLAGLGERDQAFAWLARAVAEYDPLAIMMRSDATIASLRDDPRFDELLARMGLGDPGDHPASGAAGA